MYPNYGNNDNKTIGAGRTLPLVGTLTPLQPLPASIMATVQRNKKNPVNIKTPNHPAPLPGLAPLPRLGTMVPITSPAPIVGNIPALPPAPLIQLPDIPQTPGITTLPSIPTTSPVHVSTGTVPSVPTNPASQNQYTRELMLAPLSPRSPRVKREMAPAVVTHQTVPVTTETCCVCYDEEIPTNKLLGCKHPMCGECIGQLQSPECPMCKTFIQGPLVTDVILADIMNRQEQARLNDITANYLAGVYLEEHPEADPEEVYNRYRN